MSSGGDHGHFSWWMEQSCMLKITPVMCYSEHAKILYFNTFDSCKTRMALSLLLCAIRFKCFGIRSYDSKTNGHILCVVNVPHGVLLMVPTSSAFTYETTFCVGLPSIQ